MISWRRHGRRGLGLLIALVPVLSLAAFLLAHLDRLLSFETLAADRIWLGQQVAEHPVLAPVLFTVADALALAACWPVTAVMAVAAGLLFGTLIGTCCALAAATAGAAGAFWLVRLGPARLAPRRGVFAGLRDRSSRSVFRTVLVLRLTPVVPFWLVNIGAGLLALPPWPFLLATLLGTTPLSVIYVGLGDGLDAAMASGSPPGPGLLASPLLAWPLAGAVALVLIPWAQRVWRGRRPSPKGHDRKEDPGA